MTPPLLPPVEVALVSAPITAQTLGRAVLDSWRAGATLLSFAWNAVGGMLVAYLIGIPWMALVDDPGLDEALVGSLVYVPGDLAKAVIAAVAAVIAAEVVVAVRRAYPLAEDRAA